MKKTIGILIIMVLLIFTGCSNKQTIEHNYTYKGENEFWSAEYVVNGTGIFTKKNGITEYGSDRSTTFRITYKKDLSQLSSVKHMEVSYESSAGGGKMTEDYNDGPPSEKTYTMKSDSENGAIEKKDEVIKVTINLDGEIQTIELKNVN